MHCQRHRTCDQLSDFNISCFPQKADQRWDPSAVLQGHFILVIGLAINQVPQSSAGTAVNLAHPVVQQVDQQLDAALSADLQHTDRKVITASVSRLSRRCPDKNELFFFWSPLNFEHAEKLFATLKKKLEMIQIVGEQLCHRLESAHTRLQTLSAH